MAIEVRALDQDEFNAATQGSYVYGTVSGYVKGKMLTAYVLRDRQSIQPTAYIKIAFRSAIALFLK